MEVVLNMPNPSRVLGAQIDSLRLTLWRSDSILFEGRIVNRHLNRSVRAAEAVGWSRELSGVCIFCLLWNRGRARIIIFRSSGAVESLLV
jgi:hypothetical protein